NSGEIWVEEEKLDELSVDKIRKKIGYLSQKMSFRNLVVKEVIDEILDYKSNREILFEEKKMEEILEYLKLDKKIMFQEMNDLSGGEKQRIGFLIALLMDREIWIFDEITSSLDKELKELVIDYILKSEKTVIMVSHDKIESLEKFKKVVI
ncbi:MAG: ATP-binding cassette domain-containing protein, partial [Fusobacteriaceae bacterium]